MSKLVVIGSSNTDMIVQVPRIPQPGETILGGRFQTAPGGKGANQAVAAARAGADVSLLACVGDDSFGREALAGFATDGIDCDHVVIDSTAPSGVAQIFVAADGENSIGVASGANACLTPRHIEQCRLCDRSCQHDPAAARGPSGNRNAGCRDWVRSGLSGDPQPGTSARTADGTLSPAQHDLAKRDRSGALDPGIAVKDESSAAAAAANLHDRGVDTVLITLGAAGCFHCPPEHSARSCRAYVVDVVDTTAAGDVFNGNLAAALCRDLQLEDAVVYAQAAAALSVQCLGAQPSAPTRSAIDTFLAD